MKKGEQNKLKLKKKGGGGKKKRKKSGFRERIECDETRAEQPQLEDVFQAGVRSVENFPQCCANEMYTTPFWSPGFPHERRHLGYVAREI